MKAAPRSVHQSCLRTKILFPHITGGSAERAARRARKLAKRLSSKEGRHLDKLAIQELS